MRTCWPACGSWVGVLGEPAGCWLLPEEEEEAVGAGVLWPALGSTCADAGGSTGVGAGSGAGAGA